MADITGSMWRALALSFGQLSDPTFLKVLGRSLGLTILGFVILGLLVYAGLTWLIAWAGWADGGILAALGAIALTVLGGWLLFRAVAIAVIGLFTEEIVEAVEAKHYPGHHARAVRAGAGEQLRLALRSFGRAVGWNLVALPLYALLFVTSVGTLLAVFAVNALLLSRDLADLVAMRHVAQAESPTWLQRTRWRRLQLGMVSAGLFLVPVANLLAPILSAAMAAHMLHGGDKGHA